MDTSRCLRTHRVPWCPPRPSTVADLVEKNQPSSRFPHIPGVTISSVLPKTPRSGFLPPEYVGAFRMRLGFLSLMSFRCACLHLHHLSDQHPRARLVAHSCNMPSQAKESFSIDFAIHGTDSTFPACDVVSLCSFTVVHVLELHKKCCLPVESSDVSRLGPMAPSGQTYIVKSICFPIFSAPAVRTADSSSWMVSHTIVSAASVYFHTITTSSA